MAKITDFGTVKTLTTRENWYYDNIDDFEEVTVDDRLHYKFIHFGRKTQEWEMMLLCADCVGAVTYHEE